MEITQLYEYVNESLRVATGKENILTQDLSNIVSVGDELLNNKQLDNYVNALMTHIGKVIFVSRKYKGILPKVMRDKWEFGLVVEKIRMDLPDAQENESWELRNGASYDTNIFYQPKIKTRIWNTLKTFEIPISVTYKQVMMSFSNAQQLNTFVSMIFQVTENAITKYIDELTRTLLQNAIGLTLKDSYGNDNFNSKSTAKAVNLLYLYNEDKDTTNKLTVSQALRSPDFLRFSGEVIRMTIKHLKEFSTLFNISKTTKFTEREDLHVVLLSDFASKQTVYLQSDTYHKELVDMPLYEEINFWQGTGTDYDFADTSKIDIKTTSNDVVTTSGIVGVLFDRDALGISNLDIRTTGDFNSKAEFYNYYNKVDLGLWNDPDENFVVFFLA